jgi:hypothetical protein
MTDYSKHNDKVASQFCHTAEKDIYLASLNKHDWAMLDLMEIHHDTGGLQGFTKWERFKFHTKSFYVWNIQKWFYISNLKLAFHGFIKTEEKQ